jgi:hypothetical protein
LESGKFVEFRRKRKEYSKQKEQIAHVAIVLLFCSVIPKHFKIGEKKAEYRGCVSNGFGSCSY